MFSDRFEVYLGEFEQGYFDSLDDNSEIVEPTLFTQDFYHTIFIEGEKGGVVGFIPSEKIPGVGFVQIVLEPIHRGKGLIEKVYNELANIHHLQTLYVTIRQKNTSAIRAHEKIGFKLLPEEKQQELRKKGIINENEARLVKDLS